MTGRFEGLTGIVSEKVDRWMFEVDIDKLFKHLTRPDITVSDVVFVKMTNYIIEKPIIKKNKDDDEEQARLRALHALRVARFHISLVSLLLHKLMIREDTMIKNL